MNFTPALDPCSSKSTLNFAFRSLSRSVSTVNCFEVVRLSVELLATLTNDFSMSHTPPVEDLSNILTINFTSFIISSLMAAGFC
jgi:hypothetical protein